MRPSPALNSNDREEQAIPLTTEVTIPLTPFDQREYRELIEARGETIRRVVSKLKPALRMQWTQAAALAFSRRRWPNVA